MSCKTYCAAIIMCRIYVQLFLECLPPGQSKKFLKEVRGTFTEILGLKWLKLFPQMNIRFKLLRTLRVMWCIYSYLVFLHIYFQKLSLFPICNSGSNSAVPGLCFRLWHPSPSSVILFMLMLHNAPSFSYDSRRAFNRLYSLPSCSSNGSLRVF